MSVVLLDPIEREGWGGPEKWMLALADRLKEHGHGVAACGKPASKWAGACRSHGLPTTELAMRGDFHPADLWALRRIYRERGVNLVIVKTHHCIRIAWAARVLTGGRGPAILCRMGDAVMKRSLGAKLTYRYMADRYVTPSESVRLELLAYGYFGEDRIKVIPNGVRIPPEDPTARERIRSELGLGSGPVLIVTSRLHPLKGHARLLDAVALLSEQFPSLRLVVVGDGVERRKLEEQASRPGIAGRVVFTGFRTDVTALLRAADVSVFPSLLEGMPNTVLEAMAAGLPVVASGVAGVPEVVEDGRTGLVVAPGQAELLRRAIVRLLAEPELAAAMGAAGRARAHSEFSIERMLAASEGYCLETCETRCQAR